MSGSHACTIINLWQITIMLMDHNSYTFIKQSPSSYTFSTMCFWRNRCLSWDHNHNIVYYFSYVELVETNFCLNSLRDSRVQSNSSCIISLKLHSREWWLNSTSSVFIPHDISAIGTVNHSWISSHHIVKISITTKDLELGCQGHLVVCHPVVLLERLCLHNMHQASHQDFSGISPGLVNGPFLRPFSTEWYQLNCIRFFGINSCFFVNVAGCHSNTARNCRGVIFNAPHGNINKPFLHALNLNLVSPS